MNLQSSQQGWRQPMHRSPLEFDSVDACVDAAIAVVGKRIVLGVPIGLGKPNQLINAFYRRAETDPELQLTIFTGLSLEKPQPASDVEARLLGPFIARQFGSYVELDYMRAIREARLPPNVRVHEFYFRAGSMKGIASAQRDYISTNYTCAARDLVLRGVNVMLQLVAEREVDGERLLSLSSNTDVGLDLVPMMRERSRKGIPCFVAAQVHADMPFMYNRAMVRPAFFDAVVANPDYDTTLFAAPNLSVNNTDFAIGFHASTLLRDGGTLQIGIGSLGDAIVYASRLRQQDNAAYRQIAHELCIDEALVHSVGGLGTFEEGIYGCSEMFVNGFVHLMEAGIVKREVFDDLSLQRLLDDGRISRKPDRTMLEALLAVGAVGAELSARDVDYLRHWGVLREDVTWSHGSLQRAGWTCDARLDEPACVEEICRHALGSRLARGVIMHGAFFLGPRDFYEALRDMPRGKAERIAMDSVRRINRIDDPPLQALQRRHARFMNTGMMVTLGGAVVSDGLENGEVVSGVGGQYNFVAQAHELSDARSVICIRATRGAGRSLRSNIVPSYGHVTIPRHLRDIVVTEYGVADLRGKSDEEIIRALLNVADSRFQHDLLDAAREMGKIDPDYEIPSRYRSNLPETVAEVLDTWRERGYFPPFPLGTDFTQEEIEIGRGLRDIKAMMDNPRELLRAVIRSFTTEVDDEQARPYLERIGLLHPDTAREKLLKHLLLLELEEHGVLRAM